MELRGGAMAPAVPDTLRHCADPHIRNLVALVESGAYDVLSLDVFDTLVWRAVPRPTDVFLLLGHEFHARGWLAADVPVECLARERQAAEDLARRARRSRECTLVEIWENFPCGLLATPVEVAQLADAERELEFRLVHRDEGMLALAGHAEACGLRLALVSDTYFSASDLRRFTGLDPAHVLASCEHNRGKASGLHLNLLAAVAVPAERVLHVGDHPISDVDAPHRAGIAAYHRPRLPEGWSEPLAREWSSVLDERARQLPRDDAGWTQVRVQTVRQAEDDHEAWGGAVLGPVLGSFCDWVAERTGALGARNVLCLMREGRLLRSVLGHVAPDLEAHEFFVSRYVALRAVAADADEASLLRFLSRPSPPRVARVLEQLGLAPDAIRGFEPDESLDPARVAALARSIARDARAAQRVREVCGAARDGLVAHLDSRTGGAQSGIIVLVDLGYSGTIQAALHHVLARVRPRLRLHGLYLVTGGQVGDAQRRGVSLEGWLAHNAQPIRVSHTFMRSPEVVEQAMMADCGTTLGHSADGRPCLAEVSTSEQQRHEIAAVQRGVLRYAEAWSRHRARYGAVALDLRRDWCRAILERTVARPSPMELDLFGHWAHDENLGSERTRTLVEPAGLRRWEQEHMSAHQLASLPSSVLYWPCGHAHRRSAALGEAVASLYLRRTGPEAFSSAEPPLQMAFYWDPGTGWSANCARLTQVVLASSGRLWHRVAMQLDGDVHERHAFSLGLPGDLVRWAGIRVRAVNEAGSERVWEFPAEALRFEGFEPLTPEWSIVRENPSLVITPPLGLGRFTGSLTVDAFVGWARS